MTSDPAQALGEWMATQLSCLGSTAALDMLVAHFDCPAVDAEWALGLAHEVDPAVPPLPDWQALEAG